jgi:hypothetical protein
LDIRERTTAIAVGEQKVDNAVDRSEAMMDAMVPLVRKHLVSIAACYGGEFRQHATGTLVRFSDAHFLVTAAHAIEQFHQGKEHYRDLHLVVDNGDGNLHVPLFGRYFATQKVRDRERPRILVGGERDDLWDIGIWELEPRTVELLTEKQFLNRKDISLGDLSDGLYFLAVCPCTWTDTDIEARSVKYKWFKFAARPSLDSSQLPVFDTRFHLALNVSEQAVLPTNLEGISGTSIWKLSDWPVPDDWSPDKARVVAVQTCVFTHRPPKAIRGTKWDRVIDVLIRNKPEIREGFGLWLRDA